MINFTEQNKTIGQLTASGMVIVDYFATWCGPCKQMSEILELNKEKFEKLGIKVVKVDIDQRRDLAMEAGVRSIPTFLYYRDGVELNKTIGTQTAEELIAVFGV